jgi:TM2 domain-containing membrane protein YozV
MKGQILDYSVQKNLGVISTPEGLRYAFSGAQWHGPTAPHRGWWVDFEANGRLALDVYPALGMASSLSTQMQTYAQSDKKKPHLMLWSLFLGSLGAHKFYMGSWGWGILYLVFCWTGIPAIANLVEMVRFITTTDDEFSVKLAEFQARQPGAFDFFW